MFPVATFPTATMCRTLHRWMVDHLVPASCLTAAHREPLPGGNRGAPTTESHACPRRARGILGTALHITRLHSADVLPDQGAPRSCGLALCALDARSRRRRRPRHPGCGVARLLATYHPTRESVRLVHVAQRRRSLCNQNRERLPLAVDAQSVFICRARLGERNKDNNR